MPTMSRAAGAVLVVRRLRVLLREHDLRLAAAGLTFYGAVGTIPLVLVSGRLAAALVGAARVRDTGVAAARYLPDALEVASGCRRLSAAAASLEWRGALLAVVVVSLAADGLSRALSRLAPQPSQPSWRRRLLAVPLCAVGVATALAATAGARPLLRTSFGAGVGAHLFGVWLAFVLGWLWTTGVLVVFYRWFSTQPLRWRSLVAGAAGAASWVVGQALGYVLVLRWVGSGVSSAFGGLAVAGTVAALLFLLYLENVVLLSGYAVASAWSVAARGAR